MIYQTHAMFYLSCVHPDLARNMFVLNLDYQQADGLVVKKCLVKTVIRVQLFLEKNYLHCLIPGK